MKYFEYKRSRSHRYANIALNVKIKKKLPNMISQAADDEAW